MRYQNPFLLFISRWPILSLATAAPVLAQSPWTNSAATSLKSGLSGQILIESVAALIAGVVLHRLLIPNAQVLGHRARVLSTLRVTLLMALSAAPAYAAGDMVSNFLTNLVSLLTGGWAISIVVLFTAWTGVKYYKSDRADHDGLGNWLMGSGLVLGCQIVAQQFIH